LTTTKEPKVIQIAMGIGVTNTDVPRAAAGLKV
jgi:hypothetical protein